MKRADLKGDRGVRQMGFQEIDIVRMVSPITKYAVTVMEPETIRYHLEKALYLARTAARDRSGSTSRWTCRLPRSTPRALAGLPAPSCYAPPSSQLDSSRSLSAIRLLNQAERPCVLVGNGVRSSGGLEQFCGA